MRSPTALASPRALRALAVSIFTWLILTPAAWAQRDPVEAEHGIVASASVLASRVGTEVLQRGGNAADAAVATGLALAVTYPRAGNIGGGGFAVLRLADGTATSIDFREMAPSAATRDLFLDANGNVVPGRSTVGHLASGVPGTVAGLQLLYEKYGSHHFTWAQLVEPARRLAEKGFAVSPALARDMQASSALLGRFAESRRVFLRDARPYEPGEVFKQPDLAATLRRIERQGAQEFYSGKTAQLIAREMAANGGLITLADLGAYRAVERPALQGSYRGYQIVTMAPPSSGGIALLQMLGMLERHDVASLGLNSAAKIHLFTEVMRRAFRDRAQFLGDPDFVRVPVASLLDRAYLDKSMSTFDRAHATPNSALAPADLPPPESTETTQFSIVDSQGNAVSITYTLNGLWGNGVTVGGAGFLLNNEMDDFTSKVGVRNGYGLLQGESNAVGPRKRPLSSMTPTIVLKDGQTFLVTGSPGGPTIINTVLLVITNVVDFHMSVTQAVDTPRFHHQWQPDVINHEPFFTSPDTVALLEAQGHKLATRKLYPNSPEAEGHTWGDAESILIDPRTKRRLGASDPRSPDSAAVGW
ncbi:MAG: gamma-glutamyltransferase [Gammaproteobacteria bacterium]